MRVSRPLDPNAQLPMDPPLRPTQPPAPPGRRRIWIAALLASLGLLLLLLLLAQALLPGLLRAQAIQAVREGCPSCEFRIGRVELSLLWGRAVAHDVRFVSASNSPPRTALGFRALTVRASVWSLVHGPLRIESVTVEGLEASVQDDPYGYPGVYRGPPVLATWPPLHIQKIELRDSAVRYRETRAPGEAELFLEHLDGEIGPVGTRPELAPSRTEFALRGRFQGRAAMELAASLDMLAAQGEGRVELSTRGLPMEALAGYLEPALGLSPHGEVPEATVRMRLHGGELRGTLSAEFRDLALDVRDRERLLHPWAGVYALSGDGLDLVSPAETLGGAPRLRLRATSGRIQAPMGAQQEHGDLLVLFLARQIRRTLGDALVP